MDFIGLDLGFYQVKFATKDGINKFPSVIGYPSAVELKDADDEGEAVDNIVVEDRETTYYAGTKAMRDTKNSQLTFVTDKTDSHTDRIKFFASLGLALGDKSKGEFSVVTGLPVDEFAGVDGLKEKLQENMQGNFQFGFKDKEMSVDIERVTVIPQSAGAYYDYIMDKNGVVDEELVNPKTVVIDIGYRTTDVVTMINAGYSPSESFTVNTGVSDIHKEVKRKLLRKYQLNKDITEMDALVRSQKIYLGGRGTDITGEIIDSIRPYAEKIVSNLPLYISNMREIHQIIVTGGGANLMFDYVKNEYQDIPVLHLENSEYSNARGYYKYAKFLEENRR